MTYYKNKIDLLKLVFNSEVSITKDGKLNIDNKVFEVLNDVIILKDLKIESHKDKKINVESFGVEWLEFIKIYPDHYDEFNNHFDIIDLKEFNNKIIADFGCGIGRWSKIINQKINPKLTILFDYSDAIFVARENMKQYDNVIFVKGDLEDFKFNKDIIDFFICLGVLHHLPDDMSKAIRNISNCSKSGLCYLYYNLDNRCFYFKFIFFFANLLRRCLHHIKNRKTKKLLCHFLTIFAYYPFILTARMINKFGINSKFVPLSYYINMEYKRILQDCYDRFFTNIEYRFSKNQIVGIFSKYFKRINFSNNEPYWHFRLFK